DGNTANNIISKDLAHISSINLPYSEDFESGNTLLGRVSSTSIWEISAAPKEVALNQAVKFKSFQNQEAFGEVAILETPPLDLNGVPSATLSFSFAHANVSGGFHDGLVVKASTDCGETYPDVIFSATGSNLATAPSTSSEFTPANQLQWLDTILGISAYRNFDQVKFQFIGLNGGGNNLYIDNIRIEETNVLENDVNLQSINGPLATCDEETEVSLQIRNAGSQTITSFAVAYELNGNTFNQSFNGVNVGEREYANFSLNIAPLVQNENDVAVRVIEVNNMTDESEFGNEITASINRDTSADEYPLSLYFETSDSWLNLTPNDNSLWERVTISDNGALRANSFDEVSLGTESWFISPALTTGGLDSAGLSFKVSYASREGLNDQLRVLASVNCGQSYSITLLDADADSLAITESTGKWTPSSDNDWKEFNLDLSSTIAFKDEIRIAFVFINGNGNDLYIDDIAITGNEPPSYQEIFRVFPNPVSSGIYEFNLGFNLPIKEPITV
ncbi:MAG: choice-of-anchor J domain-containing protein, partial [Bacteroidota bacterium]